MIILDDPQILEPQTATHDTNASSPASKFPLFFEWRKTSPWYPCQRAAGQPFSDWSQHSQTAREESSLNAPSIYHHEILHDYISVVCFGWRNSASVLQMFSSANQPTSINLDSSISACRKIDENWWKGSWFLTPSSFHILSSCHPAWRFKASQTMKPNPFSWL